MEARLERGWNKAKGNDLVTNRQAGDARLNACSTRLRREWGGDGVGVVQLAGVTRPLAKGYQRVAAAERPTIIVAELSQFLRQLHGGLRLQRIPYPWAR